MIILSTMKKILSVKTSLVRELYVEPINEKYVIFSDEHIEYFGKTEVDKKIIRGITLKENTENLGPKDSVSLDIPVSWMYENRGQILGIPKKVYSDLISGKIHVSEIYHNPNSSEYDPDNFVYCITNKGSYELASLDCTPIPVPIYFDYMNGLITDTKFRLNELLLYILDHPEKFVPFYRENKIEISNIPYYNADDYTGYKQIKFCYLVSQEEANELCKLSGSYEKKLYIIENTELRKFKK